MLQYFSQMDEGNEGRKFVDRIGPGDARVTIEDEKESCGVQFLGKERRFGSGWAQYCRSRELQAGDCLVFESVLKVLKWISMPYCIYNATRYITIAAVQQS